MTMRAEAQTFARSLISPSRWPSNPGIGLQNHSGECNSRTGFHFIGHKC